MATQTTVHSEGSVQTLKARWAEYQSQNKRAFMYDAAEAFGVSEAELLATDCGQSVTRLEGDWKTLLKGLHACGKVMALTRNHWAVIEKSGYYAPVNISGPHGVVLDEGIDLRLFVQKWAYAFAVAHPESKRYTRNIQFFDQAGRAVHKVYATDEGADAFDAIIQPFVSGNQRPEQSIEPSVAPSTPPSDEEIDVAALRHAWAGLEDTHDFFPMLRHSGASRTQAFRLAGAVFAERIETDSYIGLFKKAAESSLPIMVFVGNSGCIEIHTGPIECIVEMDGWFNIMDPGFNLHLRTEGVHEAWLVRKPTRDGLVTSVELFDGDGREVAIIFGKRKPGLPELPEWRVLAESMPRTMS